MTFPDIDPVLLQIGPIAIRWYALAYIAGIVLGCQYVAWANKQAPMLLKGLKPLDDLLVWLVLGIILGGRLGYVFFYQSSYYFAHPMEALYIWQGGMSFHGGLVGVIVAMALFARRSSYSFLALMDLCAVAAPIGLFFGRVANFINGELYGRVTDAAVGMVFPTGGPLPRHPSQLYEAFFEGVVLFVLLLFAVRTTPIKSKKGALAGLFLIGYGCSRFGVEFFREPDVQLGLLFSGLTMGQLLSLPMAMLGLYLCVRRS